VPLQKRTVRGWLTIKDGQRAGKTDESLGRVVVSLADAKAQSPG
jgi:hypothetical protein